MTLAQPAPLPTLELSRIDRALAQAPPDLTALRDALTDLGAALDDRFWQNAPVADLVHARSAGLDKLLARLWYALDLPPQAALVAVGGYGRGELLPASDIDLLLLFRDQPQLQAAAGQVEALVTLLWDLRLDIGHSVRTLDACVSAASDDLTIVTNLMESRHLAGDAVLTRHMQEATNTETVWPSAIFYRAKLNEQVLRHEKYGDTGYNLEPNIKSSPGGLRDIQTIGWVAKRHFGEDHLAQLVDRGFLTPRELDTLLQGQNSLWRLRYALHLLTGREEDRLLFDLQKALAQALGLEDDDQALAVEQLMQSYYRTVFHLSALNEMLLQHFDEHILMAPRESNPAPLNSRFRVTQGYIQAAHPDVFHQTPSALLEIFVLLAQHPEIKGIRATTLRALLENRHRIDPAFRHDMRNQSFFLELLRAPHGVSTNLRRMNRYGILGRYLPDFGRAIGLMQFDLFHVYTLDAHTLKTVEYLRRFRHRANLAEFPIASQVIHQLPKVDLVYLAALYHDLGKGRGGDHSELGAELAGEFCRRHQMPPRDSQLVTWLVQNHLLMSRTAQREDLSDPDVIHRFIAQVQDLVHLDYLYVLTVADIGATNPSLWNSWRAALLKQLYTEARLALRRGLDNPFGKQERIEDTQRKALAMLLEDGFTEDEIRAFWENPGDDYFLRESAENIVWHTKAITQHGEDSPLVLVQELNADAFESATQIFLYGPDRINLFADIAYAMDQLQLNIQDARIMTSSGSQYSLDTFIVLEEDGSPIDLDNPERVRQVQHALLLAMVEPPQRRPNTRRVPRTLRHFRATPRVTLSNDPFSQRTVVEVITTDRPGLLARIGEVFIDSGVYLQSARIATLGERVEDVFFVVDVNNEPLHDLAAVEQLQRRLLTMLNQLLEPDNA